MLKKIIIIGLAIVVITVVLGGSVEKESAPTSDFKEEPDPYVIDLKGPSSFALAGPWGYHYFVIATIENRGGPGIIKVIPEIKYWISYKGQWSDYKRFSPIEYLYLDKGERRRVSFDYLHQGPSGRVSFRVRAIPAPVIQIRGESNQDYIPGLSDIRAKVRALNSPEFKGLEIEIFFFDKEERLILFENIPVKVEIEISAAGQSWSKTVSSYRNISKSLGGQNLRISVEDFDKLFEPGYSYLGKVIVHTSQGTFSYPQEEKSYLSIKVFVLRGGITVSISPADVAARGPTDVSVMINGVENLGAFEITLGFSPDVVQVEKVRLGDFLGSTGNTTSPVGPVIDNSSGRVTFGGFSFGTNPGPSGSGVLAVITFVPVSNGSSDITFLSVQITDKEGETLTLARSRGGVITEVEEAEEVPEEFALWPNYPNPFNPETNIRYAIADETEVKLEVINLAGQVVRVLVDEIQSPGYYVVKWDGRDTAGRAVSAGVYLYRLRAGRFRQTRKMILIR